MTEIKQVYKCGVCGNVVEVVHASTGTLVCCGEAMELMDEQTADQATEKHVPVIENTAEGVKVTVGSIPHPMKEEHFIEWIEIQYNDKVARQYLQPGNDPSAIFKGVDADDITMAREYCNVHGLWKS